MKSLSFLIAIAFLSFVPSLYCVDVLSNLTNASTSQIVLSSPGSSAAQAFTNGPNIVKVEGFVLRLRGFGAGPHTARVKLWSSGTADTTPQTLVEDLGTVSNIPPDSDGEITVLSTMQPVLAESGRYWVSVTNEAGDFDWCNTSNPESTGTGIFVNARASSPTGNASTWTPFGVAANFQLLSVGFVLNPPIIVTNTNDSGAGSLRQALLDAATITGPDTITFHPSLNGQIISLTTIASVINGNTAILVSDKGGVTVDASALPGGLTIDDGINTNFRFILVQSGSLTLRCLTLSNGGGPNFLSSGGAIYNNARLTLERCTLSGNFAAVPSGSNPSGGGAIYNATFGTLSLTHCTLAGNGTLAGGGAIRNESTLKLTHCTLSGNSALSGGAVYNNHPVAARSSVITNCILSGNTASNSGTGGNDVFNNSGSFTRVGANIIQGFVNAGSTSATHVGPAAIVADPYLAPLGSYGGSTQTMPPLLGSPAIDAASDSTETSDQRGFARSVDGDGNGTNLPDIGAAEARRVVVTTLADENDTPAGTHLSLREALRDDATGATPADIVGFDPTLNGGTIALTASTDVGNGNSAFVIGNSIGIDASDLPLGVTLFGISDGDEQFENGEGRIFEIPAGQTLMLRRLQIVNGIADPGGSTVEATGGGILNAGGLILEQCQLANCRAKSGGGLINLSGGTTTITQTTFSGNQASETGAGIENNHVAVLMSCAVSGNHAGTKGGGILNNGALTLTHSTVSGNHAETKGGGILNNGALTLTHCTFSGNEAGSGGGVFNELAGTAFVSQGIAAGNIASTAADIGNLGTLYFTGGNLLEAPVNRNGFVDGLPTISGQPAALSPLGFHGGFTPTMRLLPGSPARNAAVGSSATKDQRGFPIFGTADLGAYEAQISAIPPTVTDEDDAAVQIAFSAGQAGALSATSSDVALVPDANIILAGSGASRSVTVIPASNANGTATITVTDSHGGETMSFPLTVNPVNDAPLFTRGPDQQVFVDSGAHTVPAWATGIAAGPANESGQSLAFSVSNDNSALFATPPALATDGTLTFTPVAGTTGSATVTVSLSDNGNSTAPHVNTSAVQIFTISVRLPNPTSIVEHATGSAAPGAGVFPSLPADAKFTSFGTPATSNTGDLAFIAKWASATGGKGTGLFLNAKCLAIVGGDASVVGGAGARWKNFSDPVVEAGRIACIAKLSTGASAVVCNLDGTSLRKIALSGEAGTSDGAKFKSFKSAIVVNDQVAFLATLANGTGVTPKTTALNDTGIWMTGSSGTGSTHDIVLREGDTAAGKTIKTLVSFLPGDGSPGCGRGYALKPSAGAPQVCALAMFTDRTRGVIFKALGETAFTPLSISDDTATGVGSGRSFASYSLPARNSSGVTAFRGNLAIASGVTAADAGGIFAGPDSSGLFTTVARAGGTAAQAAAGASFLLFKDPVLSEDGAIAFPATLKGVNGAGAKTLWWRPAGGAVMLLAQSGSVNGTPTDLPAGAQWKSFDSLAIAAGGRGPIFAATLAAGKGGVSAKNASGVWAMDFTGTLRTLFRVGDNISNKTVKSFTLLKATPGNMGATRGFNDAGEVVWLATFTDDATAIVRTVVP